MTKESWQSAIPNFTAFETILSQTHSLTPLSLLDLQPRVTASLIRFSQLAYPRFLLINAPDNLLYHRTIAEFYQDLLQKTQENPIPVITSDTIEPERLFGQYQVENGHICHQSQGLLEQAHGGYLILSIDIIIANPRLWPKLKSAILGAPCPPIQSNPKEVFTASLSRAYDVKLIIIGDRYQLAELDEFDADLYAGLSLFAEFELDYKIKDEPSFQNYICFIKGLMEKRAFPTLLNSSSWLAFLNQGARETEDQTRMPLCLLWLTAFFNELSVVSQQAPIETHHIQQMIQERYYRQSYLPNRAMDDILEGQVIIETSGTRIGQVNGLTVIEIPGHPTTYGEPARISCVIHFGDGDIADVERKAELGGNIHAKGMMIMQAFLSSALNLNEPLPFAASIVFEQSYSEVDGDSASLAELCSLVSALSEYPIKQSIAVTGAVDQFGRVQAVGGLNEKIESFFYVCRHQGFNGEQGVIIPKSNLMHLSLNTEVIDALKNEQFHIWSVDSVDQALPLIFDKAFRGDGEETILKRISERIEQFDKHDMRPCSLSERIKSFFQH